MNPQGAWVVAWPAFLSAAAIEMLVFAFVDPASLHWVSGASVGASSQVVYGVAFFAFWALAALAGAMTRRLALRPDEVNALPQATDPPRR